MWLFVSWCLLVPALLCFGFKCIFLGLCKTIQVDSRIFPPPPPRLVCFGFCSGGGWLPGFFLPPPISPPCFPRSFLLDFFSFWRQVELQDLPDALCCAVRLPKTCRQLRRWQRRRAWWMPRGLPRIFPEGTWRFGSERLTAGTGAGPHVGPALLQPFFWSPHEASQN